MAYHQDLNRSATSLPHWPLISFYSQRSHRPALVGRSQQDCQRGESRGPLSHLLPLTDGAADEVCLQQCHRAASGWSRHSKTEVFFSPGGFYLAQSPEVG